jgi:hypothetical protein
MYNFLEIHNLTKNCLSLCGQNLKVEYLKVNEKQKQI